jgi:hypothetical protein
VAEGDGLENRCGVQASPWVRIPHPPRHDTLRECTLRRALAEKVPALLAD